MTVVPLTLHRANEIVAEHHRHNEPVRGCRFAIGAEHGGELVGVAIVGRPVARMLDRQKVAELTRLCIIPGAPRNTCSFLYGAARRVWFAMGGERIITYTLARESGASLRGAGWKPAAEVTGEQWSRPSRERVELNDVGVYVRLLPVGTPVAKTEVKCEWPHVAVDRAADGKVVGIEYVPVPPHFSLEVIARKAGVKLRRAGGFLRRQTALGGDQSFSRGAGRSVRLHGAQTGAK